MISMLVQALYNVVDGIFVARYSACKEDAARRFPEDIEGYMACKGPCIEALYKLCGLSE